jgi:hypothetical protein
MFIYSTIKTCFCVETENIVLFAVPPTPDLASGVGGTLAADFKEILENCSLDSLFCVVV